MTVFPSLFRCCKHYKMAKDSAVRWYTNSLNLWNYKISWISILVFLCFCVVYTRPPLATCVWALSTVNVKSRSINVRVACTWANRWANTYFIWRRIVRTFAVVHKTLSVSRLNLRGKCCSGDLFTNSDYIFIFASNISMEFRLNFYAFYV